ncbi:MAG: HAD family hydrolase [Bdellovibrionota bacterium]
MKNKTPPSKAIFLDRDGTLIVDKVYLNDPEQIEYLPGVFSALRELRDAGFIFLIVTNQSGIPRGLVSIDNLNEIHRRIRYAFSENGVDLQEFYYAPYPTDSEHPMRKPNPGMILQGAKDYNVDLSQSWMIGDRMIDVEAGHRAGVKTIMVGPREKASDFPKLKPPTGVFPNIIDAVPFILAQSGLKSMGEK